MYKKCVLGWMDGYTPEYIKAIVYNSTPVKARLKNIVKMQAIHELKLRLPVTKELTKEADKATELDQRNTKTSLPGFAKVNQEVLNIQEKPDETIILDQEAQKTLGIIIFLQQIQEVISTLNTQLFIEGYEEFVQFNHEAEAWGIANALVDVY